MSRDYFKIYTWSDDEIIDELTRPNITGSISPTDIHVIKDGIRRILEKLMERKT